MDYVKDGRIGKIDSSTLMPLPTQVGGLSHPPVLKLEPTLILKPVHVDDRGLREVVFYEAIRLASSYHTTKSSKTLEFPFPNESHSSLDGFAVRSYLKLMGIVKEDHHSSYSQAHNHYMESSSIIRLDACDLTAAQEKTRFLPDEKEYVVLSSPLQKLIKNEIETLIQLKPFIPLYYGVHQEELKDFVILQDLTAPFRNPCVLDLKMGRQSYEPDATTTRKEYEIRKYPEQKLFGFRIVGMRVASNQANDQQQQLLDKYHGYSLKTEAQLQDSFQLFLRSCHNQEKLQAVVREFLSQLHQLTLCFEQNQSLSFYASSLLLVYEGDDSTARDPYTRPIVRMIDFGHVRRQVGGDHGFIHGLNTIAKLLHLALERDKRG